MYVFYSLLLQIDFETPLENRRIPLKAKQKKKKCFNINYNRTNEYIFCIRIRPLSVITRKHDCVK